MPYKPRIKLWPHQAKALAKMRGNGAFALLLAMRTGKTAVSLADYGEMVASGKVRDHLVIAPAGVYRTWEVAMAEHLDPPLLAAMAAFTWEAGLGKRARNELEHFLAKTGPRTLLMNVEALSRPGEARAVAKRFLDGRDAIVTIDESVVIKNKSKRTEFIIKHIRPLAKYRRILSGLPTPRSPLDLFFQFEFLDWEILGFRSYYAFRAHVAIMKQQWFGGRSVQLVVGYKPESTAELQKLIAPHSFRVEFRPKIPSTYSIREVELTREQRKAYDDLKEFATTELASGEHVTSTVVIAQMMRMHQVLCGHTVDENGIEHQLPERRTAALLEILDDYSGKAVIWFSYRTDLERAAVMIQEEHGPNSVAKFYGGNKNSREDQEKRFKTRADCRFMLATTGAGGRGRTWPNADLIIYYSSTDNLDHREQSEQRTMARDKMIAADFIDLVAPGTIDMKILHAMRKKINMSTAINGDNYKEWIV